MKKGLAAALSTLFAFTALPAVAEIVSSADNGFAIAHETVIEASAPEVWEMLIDPAAWWNGEHSWSGDASKFTLAPVAGGCFCETWTADNGAANSVRHMTVESALAGKRLVLSGGLGPLQDQGVDGALAFTLTEEDGVTTLTTTYRVGGYIDGMDQWAGPVDAVIGEQHDRLTRLVATGSPDPDTE